MLYHNVFDSIKFKPAVENEPVLSDNVVTYADICSHFKISLYHAKLYLKKANIKHIAIKGLVNSDGKKRHGRRVKCFSPDVIDLLAIEMAK